jgi:hypothetical protein
MEEKSSTEKAKELLDKIKNVKKEDMYDAKSYLTNVTCGTTEFVEGTRLLKAKR